MLKSLNLLDFMKTLRKLILVLVLGGLLAFTVCIIYWAVNLPIFKVSILLHIFGFYTKLIGSWYWTLALVLGGSLVYQLYSNDGVFQTSMIWRAIQHSLCVVAVLFAGFGFGLLYAPLNPLYLHVIHVWVFLELTFLSVVIARRQLRRF